VAGERGTVLVVEDDRALAVGLDLNLTAEGFEVLVARDGDTGLRLALEADPDLIVLDLMLPGLDGVSLLSDLRGRGRQVPVIILSARGEETDKVDGLSIGADDYVTKPFGLRELLARVHAALRRSRLVREAGREVCFSDVAVDLGARVVRKGWREVQLTAREFELLAYLVEHPGRVHPRGRLLAAAWGFDYEGTERTVDNFVRSLRVKLEDDPKEPRHLVTVRGVGYRFEPEG